MVKWCLIALPGTNLGDANVMMLLVGQQAAVVALATSGLTIE